MGINLDDEEEDLLAEELAEEMREFDKIKVRDRRGGKCEFGKGCRCDSPCANPNKDALDAIARGAQW